MRKINKQDEGRSKNIFYTTHEAAQICNVTNTTIIQWLKKKNLDDKIMRTVGGHRRIPEGILKLFMNSYNNNDDLELTEKSIEEYKKEAKSTINNINKEIKIENEEKDMTKVTTNRSQNNTNKIEDKTPTIEKMTKKYSDTKKKVVSKKTSKKNTNK